MIRLLHAEWSRLWARRMTKFFPLGLAVLFVVGIVIAYNVIDNRGDNERELTFLDDFAGGVEAPDVLGPITILLPLMAFVIGASSIGADAKSGMLEQLLTWEPRRLRLLFARLVTSSVVTAILAIGLSSFLVALLYGLASTTGSTEGTTGELWTNVVFAIVRSGIVAAVFCALGVSITLLVDSSVGSIVGFLIYWFVIENLVSAFLGKVAVYLPIVNGDSFASGRDVERIEGSAFGGTVDFVRSHGSTTAGLYLAAWTLVGVVLAAVVFQRRDID